MLRMFFQYLKQNQPTMIRHAHLTVMVLVIAEILLSYAMDLRGASTFESVAMWAHMIIGLFMCVFAPALIVAAFKCRGIRHYFPYLFGDFGQLSKDIKQLLHFKLPDAEPRGLASIVQGLGLGALGLVVLSGLAWFVAWQMQLENPWVLLRWHKRFTSLLEIYVVAHAIMGIIHVALANKSQLN